MLQGVDKITGTWLETGFQLWRDCIAGTQAATQAATQIPNMTHSMWVILSCLNSLKNHDSISHTGKSCISKDEPKSQVNRPKGYYVTFSQQHHKVKSFLTNESDKYLLQSYCTALHYSARCSCYFVHPVYSISNRSCHKKQSVLTEGNWKTDLWGIDVIWSNHWRSDFLTLSLKSSQTC